MVGTRAVPETGSGVEFQRIVLKGAPYANKHHLMQTYRHMVNYCSKSGFIGYIPTTSHYFRNLDDRGVKTIPVKTGDESAPIFPPSGLVNDSHYPIMTPFYLYWNTRQDSPCVVNFPSFCEREKSKIQQAAR